MDHIAYRKNMSTGLLHEFFAVVTFVSWSPTGPLSIADRLGAGVDGLVPFVRIYL